MDESTKIRMYQGGERIEGVGTYTANVFFNYDLRKNSEIPENIYLKLDNSPNYLVFYGIMKINNP